MTMIGQEKPSLEDLVHYGVLGMKWGKHRAKASAADIHAARQRQSERRQAHRTASREFQTAVKSKTMDYAGDVAKLEKVQATSDAIFDNSDRAIALRLTRGEKALSVLLTGPVGLVVIGATSAASRRQEQRTDKWAKQP